MTLINNLGNHVGVFGVVIKGKGCISQVVDIQVWAPGTVLVTWAWVVSQIYTSSAYENSTASPSVSAESDRLLGRATQSPHT